MRNRQKPTKISIMLPILNIKIGLVSWLKIESTIFKHVSDKTRQSWLSDNFGICNWIFITKHCT